MGIVMGIVVGIVGAASKRRAGKALVLLAACLEGNCGLIDGLRITGVRLARSNIHNGILVALEEVQFAVGPGYNRVNVVGKW